MTAMSQKDRFDAFMKLSDFRFARWANRRQYEMEGFFRPRSAAARELPATVQINRPPLDERYPGTEQPTLTQ